MAPNPELKEMIEPARQSRNSSQLYPRLARFAIAGTLFLAAVESQINAEPNQAVPLSPAIAEGRELHVPEVEDKAKNDEDSQPVKRTSIRRRANDIQVGSVTSDEAGFFKIGDGYEEKGWVYGVIGVNGIWKCGFVKEGVLPNKKPRSRSVTHCKNYYQTWVLERDVFFEDYNCPEAKKGLEGCYDGTFFTPTSKECPVRQTYRNFETDEPSPLNIFGTGNGGFRDAIKSNKKTSFHYRVKIQPGSEDGQAIVVRAPEWSLTRDDCADKGRVRRGGPKTLEKIRAGS